MAPRRIPYSSGVTLTVISEVTKNNHAHKRKYTANSQTSQVVVMIRSTSLSVRGNSGEHEARALILGYKAAQVQATAYLQPQPSAADERQ